MISHFLFFMNDHSLSFPQKWSFILIVICGHYNNVAVNIHIYAVNIHIYARYLDYFCKDQHFT